jgi:hypothetical protein
MIRAIFLPTVSTTKTKPYFVFLTVRSASKNRFLFLSFKTESALLFTKPETRNSGKEHETNHGPTLDSRGNGEQQKPTKTATKKATKLTSFLYGELD